MAHRTALQTTRMATLVRGTAFLAGMTTSLARRAGLLEGAPGVLTGRATSLAVKPVSHCVQSTARSSSIASKRAHPRDPVQVADSVPAIKRPSRCDPHPVLPAYFGYIGMHFGALIALMLQHPDPRLGAKLPAMTVAMMIALVVIAVRTHRMLREKLLLGIRAGGGRARDPLTGLRNRHFVTAFLGEASAQVLGEWLGAAGRRPVEQKRSFAMLLVDLDRFKVVNDTHGHVAGDRVLQAFAEVARQGLRPTDLVARWGGEEFLVVVETRDREAVLQIGERLRRLAAHRTLAPGGAAVVVGRAPSALASTRSTSDVRR